MVFLLTCLHLLVIHVWYKLLVYASNCYAYQTSHIFLTLYLAVNKICTVIVNLNVGQPTLLKTMKICNLTKVKVCQQEPCYLDWPNHGTLVRLQGRG